MMELITLTGVILNQSAKLLENPAVGDAFKGVVNWIGGVLGNKPSAQEKLEKIERAEHTEETVKSIESKLEFVLEDNEELQKQLAAKIEELQQVAQKEGVPMVTKTNTMTVTGNENISFQDVNSGGNINITR